eukprot:c15479_g1_i1 orf=1-417(-)
MYSSLRGRMRHLSYCRIVSLTTIYGVPRYPNIIQKRQFSKKAGSFSSNVGHFWPFILSIAAASGILGGSLLVLSDAEQQTPVSTQLQQSTEPDKRRKKVLVLGTGWAAMSFLKSVDSTLYDVQVVSPRNFFVFTPLLPS